MKPLDPRVLPHLAAARGALSVVVVGNVASGVLVVGQAFALAGLLVTLLAGPGSTDWHRPALVLVAVIVARSAVSGIVDVASARAAATVSLHLRHRVLRRALDLAPHDLARHRVGELGLLGTRGVAAVEPYITRYLPALVVAAILPALTVLAIASQDWLSALIVVLTLPLVPVFAALIGVATRDRADRQWRVLAQLSGHFADVVRGLPTLVAHRRATAQAPTIRAITDRYRRANAAVLRLAFASSAALELIATLSVALVAVIVGLRLADGGLDFRTALTVLLLAPEAYWPLRRVGAEFHAASEGTATFEEIHALTSPDLPAGGGSPVPAAPAPIRIDGLTVTWPGRSRPALDRLDATIPATGLTVIAGPSGCGKSTLLAALLGEVPLTAGLIRVGGVDRGSFAPDAWRERVAHLPQRPWLTDDTIAANVLIGRPSATTVEVRAALARVEMLDVVEALPHGLGTSLGEDGAGLSAGQRARLALARVVLADRPFLLLDEPTAHLDADTEQILLRTIRDLARTRCVIAVAHRDALIDAADHVIRLTGPSPFSPVDRGTGHWEGERLPVKFPFPRSTGEKVSPSHPHPRPRLRLALATGLAVLAASSGVALTATAGWLIARAAEQPPVLVLMVAIVGVRTFGLARPVLRYAERLLSHDVALRLLAERRASVYDALVPLVPGRLGRHRGDLLTSLVDDVDALLDDRLRVRMPVLTWLGTGLLTSIVAALFLPVAGLVTAALVTVTGVLAWTTARVGAQRSDRVGVAARAELSRRTLGLLDSARQLVLWQADQRALAAVDEVGARQGELSVRSSLWLAGARAWPLLGAAAGVGALAWVGGRALETGAVSGPVVALLVLLPVALVDVLTPVADAGALRVSTRAATARVDTLARLTPAVIDPVTPVPLPHPADRVTLEEVTAGWEGHDVLGPLSLDLTRGRRIGVVGPSGSGKSTLAAVLVRFLASSSGQHRVAGVDADHLTADDVRRVVGLVDDDPHLFGSTLAENVRLARPGADDLDVELALRRAGLEDWLSGLPDGLDTRIGDGGAAVSGGERARIALARAVLADLPILVLDEPTAHLDADTARRVTDDLLGTGEERSIVWITHGTVGLAQMDDVVTLDAGSTAPLPG